MNKKQDKKKENINKSFNIGEHRRHVQNNTGSFPDQSIWLSQNFHGPRNNTLKTVLYVKFQEIWVCVDDNFIKC